MLADLRFFHFYVLVCLFVYMWWNDGLLTIISWIDDVAS